MNSPTKRALKRQQQSQGVVLIQTINEQPNQKGTETHWTLRDQVAIQPSMNSPTKRALKPGMARPTRYPPYSINEQPNQKGTETLCLDALCRNAITINEQPNQKGTETSSRQPNWKRSTVHQ